MVWIYVDRNMINWLMQKYLGWIYDPNVCWYDRCYYEYEKLNKEHKNLKIVLDALIAVMDEPNINRIEYIGHLERKVRHQKKELKLLNRAYNEMLESAMKNWKELCELRRKLDEPT